MKQDCQKTFWSQVNSPRTLLTFDRRTVGLRVVETRGGGEMVRRLRTTIRVKSRTTSKGWGL